LKPFVYFFRLIIVIYFIILLKEEANTDKQDLVVYIIGGDCCPKQNIQLDLFNGKITTRKKLPQDCFKPVCAACNNSIFVAPSINISYFEEILEYNCRFDKWTKLINPYSFETSRNCLEKVNQTQVKSSENGETNLISVYENKGQLNIVIIEKIKIIFLIYDTVEAIWTSPTVINKKEETILFWCSYLNCLK